MGSELGYKPVSVKDLLKALKNLSGLMVNLSFSAIIFGDKTLAQEVLELENIVDKEDMLLTMQAALATRRVEDAERMVSVFKLAEATNMISDSAGDIAKTALSKIQISKDVSYSFLDSEEIIARFVARDTLDLKTIEWLMTASQATADVLAVRRGRRVILEPEPGFALKKGDVVILKGSFEALKAISNVLGIELFAGKISKDSEYKEILGDLIQIRNTALVMVDLAYTSVLTKSEELAEKVVDLEDYVDRMLETFERKVLMSDPLPLDEKLALLHIAMASEGISDAALKMVQPLLAGLEPHDIIAEVLEETYERISVIEMDEEDEGKTLSELGYSKRGMTVLAIKRGDEWIVMPPYSGFKVRKGDILMVKYVSESEKYLDELEKEEDREEIIEDIQEEEWEEE